jgi:hypothetical protein
VSLYSVSFTEIYYILGSKKSKENNSYFLCISAALYLISLVSNNACVYRHVSVFDVAYLSQLIHMYLQDIYVINSDGSKSKIMFL